VFTGSGEVVETDEPCRRPVDELDTAALLDYVERFNDLIDSKQYNMAAVHAANSPQGILRTVDTLHRLAGSTMQYKQYMVELTGTSSSSNLLRSRCMTFSSYQFLPLFPVVSVSFECHILSFHQVAQQVHSFPTSCSLPPSSLDYIMQ